MNTEGRARAIGGRGGTSRHAESAVTAGLKWLAKAQEADGRWDGKSWGGRAPYAVGMTGLALLAFQGAGYTDTKGPHRTTVAKGLKWLADSQKPDGRFPCQTFYEQGIATQAVAEAYALTRRPSIGRVAQRAVDHICAVQPSHGGFRYGGAVPKGEGDLSVTVWQVFALVSARCAGLNVPDQALVRSRAFLASTRREYGQSAYLAGSQRAGSPGVSAIGMLCPMFLGGKGADDHIRAAASFLLSKELAGGKPVPGGQSKLLVTDLYYTYYSALAMHQMGGEYWVSWNSAFRDELCKAQVHKIHDVNGLYIRGSWEPANHKWAKHSGGRVYTTAMAVLCLETPYRYARVRPQPKEPPPDP